MRNVFFILVVAFFLNGCFQVMALVGPAVTGATGGNIYQSALSYSLSYGVKKTTGRSIIENVILSVNDESESRKK